MSSTPGGALLRLGRKYPAIEMGTARLDGEQ
jgi:hypothetical protein